jgi:hypothetical protein
LDADSVNTAFKKGRGEMEDAFSPQADEGDSESDVRAVADLDAAWNQAYTRGEREPLREILSPDFIAVAPSGEEVPRSRLLKAPKEAAIQVRFSESTLRCWGPTATTRGRITVETPSEVIDQRYMRVYSKRHGRWWAVSVQVVPMPGRQAAEPPPPAPLGRG